MRPALLTLGILLGLAACRVEVGGPQTAVRQQGVRGKVTIYSSMYREVIDEVDPLLEAELPDVDIEWLQAGSEKIATRLDAELAAGATPADLVLTSDPLWYERLARAGHFRPYASLRALPLDRRFVRPDGAYVTSRLSTMVIAYDTRKITADEAPKTWADLFSGKWPVTMPDPLGSGTAFSSVALLFAADPSIEEAMRSAKVVASGGNSSVITRIESGEQTVGMVLLENVLEAQTRKGPIGLSIPSDGPIGIPGPIAILQLAPNPEAAQAVYDRLLSEPVQKLMVKGRLHSPYERVAAPIGAPSSAEIAASKYQVTPEFLDRTLAHAEELKARFSELGRGE
jgi:iron(III) transport system substrate-binding protein